MNSSSTIQNVFIIKSKTLYSLKEVSIILGVSVKTALKWLKSTDIKPITQNGKDLYEIINNYKKGEFLILGEDLLNCFRCKGVKND
jgi:hypothetical protein